MKKITFSGELSLGIPLIHILFSDLNSHCSLSLGTLCLLYLSSGPPPITRSQKEKQSLPPTLHMSLLPFLHPSQKLWTSQNNAIAKENTAMRRCHSNGRWQRLLRRDHLHTHTYTHSQASLRLQRFPSDPKIIGNHTLIKKGKQFQMWTSQTNYIFVLELFITVYISVTSNTSKIRILSVYLHN